MNDDCIAYNNSAPRKDNFMSCEFTFLRINDRT